MKRQFRGAAFAAAPFLIGSAAHAQTPYTAPRNAVVDASGAKSVEVEAAAGLLRVEGKPGLREVQVTGTARASTQQLLSEIKLIAERRGDLVFIKADIPDHDGWREKVNGDVRVSDGSGEINVRNVSGSFVVESDGSGSIYATDVKGSVIVQNDGSGSIDVKKVGKDFRVESKGGGSIDYSEVIGRVDIPERHRDRHYRSGGDQ